MQVVEQALQDADLHKDAIDFLVLHQANQRILDSAAQRLGVPSERVVSNLAGKRLLPADFTCQQRTGRHFTCSVQLIFHINAAFLPHLQPSLVSVDIFSMLHVPNQNCSQVSKPSLNVG